MISSHPAPLIFVIPAKAGTQSLLLPGLHSRINAFAKNYD